MADWAYRLGYLFLGGILLWGGLALGVAGYCRIRSGGRYGGHVGGAAICLSLLILCCMIEPSVAMQASAPGGATLVVEVTSAVWVTWTRVDVSGVIRNTGRVEVPVPQVAMRVWQKSTGATLGTFTTWPKGAEPAGAKAQKALAPGASAHFTIVGQLKVSPSEGNSQYELSLVSQGKVKFTYTVVKKK